MYTAATIDESAEREAIALSRFCILTDAPEPEDPRIELARQIETAMRLGIKPKPSPRYPRQKFIRAWVQICEAIEQGKPLPKRAVQLPLTIDDRTRRLAKRVKRVDAFNGLVTQPGKRSLSMAEASQLAGWSKRALQRAALKGKLPAKKAFIRKAHSVPGRGEYIVTIASLRQFLATRVAA